MTRSILFAAALAAGVADAATTVAVLEIGKGGVVRRTTSTSAQSNVAAVASLWSSMHTVNNGRRGAGGVPHPGMSVVPDLFNKADGGVAIGIVGSAVDLSSMPTVAGLLEEGSQAGKNGVVGHLRLSGKQGLSLMKKASKNQEIVDASQFGSTLQKMVKPVSSKDGVNVLETVAVRLEKDTAAAEADAHLAKMLSSLQHQASKLGSTVVVHLVVEEEEGAARRRQLSRRLEDEQDDEEDDEDEDNNNGNNNNNNNNNNAQDGYYGSGYYNSDGEWVSTYKTIFQIQYFNIVLWTSIALIFVMIYSNMLTLYMPLMPDTLLFGESSKMMGE